MATTDSLVMLIWLEAFTQYNNEFEPVMYMYIISVRWPEVYCSFCK